MNECLASMLRRMRAESLISEAETIHAHPVGDERTTEAETLVREAMLQRTLGRLRQEEESRIFSLLNFVMPDDAPYFDEPWPLETDDEPAE